MMSICIYSSTIHWSGNLDRQWATEPDLASVVSNGLVEATIRGWTDVRTRRAAIGKVSNKLHNGFGMGRAVPSRIHTEHNSVENHDLLDLSLCANICCLTFLLELDLPKLACRVLVSGCSCIP